MPGQTWPVSKFPSVAQKLPSGAPDPNLPPIVLFPGRDGCLNNDVIYKLKASRWEESRENVNAEFRAFMLAVGQGLCNGFDRVRLPPTPQYDLDR